MFHFEYFIYVSCYMHVPIFEIKKCKEKKYGNEKWRVEKVHIPIQTFIVYISRALNDCSWKPLKMVIVNYLSMDEILI